MHAFRSHNCNELRADQVGETVRLSGWVHRKRDHGGLMFIDLRDHFGLTQCVIEPENQHFAVLERLRVESVITVTGKVVDRLADAKTKTYQRATLNSLSKIWISNHAPKSCLCLYLVSQITLRISA